MKIPFAVAAAFFIFTTGAAHAAFLSATVEMPASEKAGAIETWLFDKERLFLSAAHDGVSISRDARAVVAQNLHTPIEKISVTQSGWRGYSREEDNAAASYSLRARLDMLSGVLFAPLEHGGVTIDYSAFSF